jgi:hypothetical protein
MSDGSKDLRERVTDIAGRAGDRAAEVSAGARTKGEQARVSSARRAREVAAGAKRNKAMVAGASAAAAVMAAVLAAWRIIARRRKSAE